MHWVCTTSTLTFRFRIKKDWLFIERNCKIHRNRWVLLILPCPQCLSATHLSSPDVGNGLSWPKPQCTCNAMVTSQAQHSTNEGVLRSNSACSMLMSDDLRLPRRGIEPRPFGFRSTRFVVKPEGGQRGVSNVFLTKPGGQ